jgi:hypothetical protein
MTTSSTHPHGRSPEELQREVKHERARVEDTIQALQEKMSVGNIVDQVLDTVRTHGGDVGRNFGRQVKDNPLPLLLTGVGIAWLMSSDGRGARDRSYDDDYDRDDDYGYDSGDEGEALGYQSNSTYGAPPVSSYRTATPGTPGVSVSQTASAQDSGASVGQTEASMHDKVRAEAENVASSTRGRIDQAKAATQSGLNRAKDAANIGLDQTRTSISSARRRTKRLAYRSRDRFGSLLEEQPLVVGALALAAGAALGSALPRSRAEDRLMGEHSDAVAQGVRDIAREEGEKAKAVAGAAADEALKIVDEAAGKLDENTPSGRDMVDKAEQSAKSAAERVANVAREEAKKQNLAGGPGGTI